MRETVRQTGHCSRRRAAAHPRRAAQAARPASPARQPAARAPACSRGRPATAVPLPPMPSASLGGMSAAGATLLTVFLSGIERKRAGVQDVLRCRRLRRSATRRAVLRVRLSDPHARLTLRGAAGACPSARCSPRWPVSARRATASCRTNRACCAPRTEQQGDGVFDCHNFEAGGMSPSVEVDSHWVMILPTCSPQRRARACSPSNCGASTRACAHPQALCNQLRSRLGIDGTQRPRRAVGPDPQLEPAGQHIDDGGIARVVGVEIIGGTRVAAAALLRPQRARVHA